MLLSSHCLPLPCLISFERVAHQSEQSLRDLLERVQEIQLAQETKLVELNLWFKQ
jgi:hypothetical protein